MKDYISREAVLGPLKTWRDAKNSGYSEGEMNIIRAAIYEIETAPAADVAPVVHGRWDRKPDPFGFFDTIPVCSACGNTTKWREEYPHCPNCGARMDGGEKDAKIDQR